MKAPQRWCCSKSCKWHKRADSQGCIAEATGELAVIGGDPGEIDYLGYATRMSVQRVCTFNRDGEFQRELGGGADR
jgi:hypothetical protein